MQPLSPAVLTQLTQIVGEKHIFTTPSILLDYSNDQTEDLSFPPQVVLKPSTKEQVSQIMKLANEHKIPVTPIGGRTGLSGGALAVFGGIGLSMERFDKIIEIDQKNLQVTVEPGVITQVLQEAVVAKGLFYPVDPSSRGSCFIGGNIAENSGGTRAVNMVLQKIMC